MKGAIWRVGGNKRIKEQKKRAVPGISSRVHYYFWYMFLFFVFVF